MKTYLEKLNTKIQKYKKIWKQNICNKLLIEICNQLARICVGRCAIFNCMEKKHWKKVEKFKPIKKNIHNAKKYAKNGWYFFKNKKQNYYIIHTKTMQYF